MKKESVFQATQVEYQQIASMHEHYRQEMNCQIVYDSMHVRQGWGLEYLLSFGGRSCGYGSLAMGGPWKEKPTVYEFYVAPEDRGRAFDLFETFLTASEARFFEVQSSDTLLTAMLHTYGRDVVSESIVFEDQLAAALPANGATLTSTTSEGEIQEAMEHRQGGGEWVLELNGTIVGKGGILFHYNPPYGDIYMETKEPFRRRGYGSYLVQELKRVCYELGAIPCARCNPANIASRRTLQRAGFVPYAHILGASVKQ